MEPTMEYMEALENDSWKVERIFSVLAAAQCDRYVSRCKYWRTYDSKKRNFTHPPWISTTGTSNAGQKE